MGSTRHRAEFHQRAAKACIPCKTAKKRCIGGVPCTYCINHRRASSCRYSDDAAAPRLPQVGRGASSAPSTTPSSRDPVFSNPDQIPIVAPPTNYSEVENEADNALSDSINTQSPDTTKSFVHARLLKNPKGSEVYVGSNAIISFLPLLRNIFKQSVGSTAFTEPVSHGMMLEGDSPSERTAPIRETTSLIQKMELVKIFFAATSGMLDIVNMSDIRQALKGEDSPPGVDPHQSAISCLAVAIGAQCHPDPILYQMCERSHFERARPYLSFDALEDISLDRIRLFMLAAVYMINACNRNMGYMYLGLAARAAHVMGLHQVGLFPDLAEAEKDSRIRIWKSLRVLETLVSSFLGRPAATLHPSREPAGTQPGTPTTASARSVPISANFQLIEILDDILENMFRQNTDNIGSAKACIDKLTNWSLSLPQILHKTTDSTPLQTSYQEQTIGNLHVACSYYFALILVTRPFLIFNCLQKHTHTQTTSGSDPTENLIFSTTLNADVVVLAKCCEDAAVFMASACHDALEEDMLLDNMCLLQAFIFASALILGLVLFTDNDSERDVGRALKEAVAVMDKLSRRSRQAEHYLLILCDMQRDVEQFQEQRAARRRESSRRPVKKLQQLILETSQDFQQSDEQDNSGSGWAQPENINLDGFTSSTYGFPPTSSAVMSDVDAMISGWNISSIQFWDDAFGPV